MKINYEIIRKAGENIVVNDLQRFGWKIDKLKQENGKPELIIAKKEETIIILWVNVVVTPEKPVSLNNEEVKRLKLLAEQRKAAAFHVKVILEKDKNEKKINYAIL